MNVLVACEESQRVTTEFRRVGHNAFSCDIIDQSGGHPEWHIKQDVVPLLNGNCKFTTTDGTEHEINGRWDLIIGHPPCTYISNAGAQFLYPKGVLNEERLRKGIKATHFFLRILYADCDHIAVENPIPSSVYCLPPYTQVIQPYNFGHPFKKKTCLWLKGLPLLQHTKEIPPEECQSTMIARWFNRGSGTARQRNRSKTFPGIAKAMAEQWGRYDGRLLYSTCRI